MVSRPGTAAHGGFMRLGTAGGSSWTPPDPVCCLLHYAVFPALSTACAGWHGLNCCWKLQPSEQLYAGQERGLRAEPSLLVPGRPGRAASELLGPMEPAHGTVPCRSPSGRLPSQRHSSASVILLPPSVHGTPVALGCSETKSYMENPACAPCPLNAVIPGLTCKAHSESLWQFSAALCTRS